MKAFHSAAISSLSFVFRNTESDAWILSTSGPRLNRTCHGNLLTPTSAGNPTPQALTSMSRGSSSQTLTLPPQAHTSMMPMVSVIYKVGLSSVTIYSIYTILAAKLNVPSQVIVQYGVRLPTWRGNWKRGRIRNPLTLCSVPTGTCTCTGLGAHTGWPSECSAEECYNNNNVNLLKLQLSKQTVLEHHAVILSQRIKLFSLTERPRLKGWPGLSLNPPRGDGLAQWLEH